MSVISKIVAMTFKHCCKLNIVRQYPAAILFVQYAHIGRTKNHADHWMLVQLFCCMQYTCVHSVINKHWIFNTGWIYLFQWLVL